MIVIPPAPIVTTVDAIIGAPSSVTYLMLTVTVVDIGTTATHEVRYPIRATEETDTDNDGVPDNFEYIQAR